MAKLGSNHPRRPLLLFQRSMAMFLVLALGVSGYPAEAFAAQDAAPAQADTSPEALDHLLAPIALYPDALLMQVLAASVDSQEVLDAGNWLLENKSLQGTQIDDAAKKLGFGVPMTALLHFPEVVDMMCTQLDWTRQLGLAFSADQAAVLDSVQRLRAQAVQYGNLKSSQQQQVVTQTENGKQVIVIQPANPEVVYVPQYNPQTVYVEPPGPSTGDVVAASVISFGLGVAVGSMFSNNNYYYPRWGYGGIYYGGRPWYPHSYVYRPIYGPAWRPPPYYRPPPHYPYHRPPKYNNNYWNNYRPGGPNYRPPGNGGNNGRPPGNGGNNGRPPGNGGYPGNTKPGNGGPPGYNKPGNGNNNGRPGGNNGGGNNGGPPGYNKPGNGGNNGRPPANGGNNGGPPGYNKPGNGGNGGTRPPGNGNRWPPTGGNTTRPVPDRGYTRPAPSGNQTRPAPQTRPVPGGGQARPGGSSQARPAQPARPAPQARPAPTRQAPAFAGGGSGKSANAASQRGAASMGGRKR